MSIVELAHTLDLRVVAEGCESEAQWQAIVESECAMVQGWLIAGAMEATAASRFLATHRHAPTPPEPLLELTKKA